MRDVRGEEGWLEEELTEAEREREGGDTHRQQVFQSSSQRRRRRRKERGGGEIRARNRVAAVRRDTNTEREEDIRREKRR